MRDSEIPPTEERGPQTGDKIRILLKGVNIREIADGAAYFSHMGEQLKVSINKLTPTEEGDWTVENWQEIHTADPNREEIWQKAAANSRDDLVDIFHTPADDLQ